jgi:uncharacterized repeat protein (TIGR03809 family)
MHDSTFTSWRPGVFARKWHALAERRRNHLAELYDNGRWKRYFSEETFRVHMREAVREVEHWSSLVDEPEPAASESRKAAPAATRVA